MKKDTAARHSTGRTTRVRHAWIVLLIVLAAHVLPATAQETTFTVTVEDKTSEHPFFGQGFNEGFVVDGVQGRELTLQRGQTYTFQMQDVPAIHPFYLTTSEVGQGAEAYTEGVTGNFATGNETLTFTPDENTPDVLYYNCQSHAYMGSRINIVSSTSAQEADLALVAGGFTHPVFLTEAPDGSGRLFVVDQTGQIYIIGPDGTGLDEPFLDIQDRMVELDPAYDERGLLGLAFHPDYADNGRFFVYYSAPLREEAPDDFNNTSHLSEFTVSETDSNAADPNSERILLQVDQPQSNHAAGTIAFGPEDGFLYVALGDGGGANDVGVGHVEDWYADNEGGNGQDIEQNLLGSILRIDVDNGDPYAIPADNPFVGTGVPEEQFAYGFRNPYRFSFDMGGEFGLLVGDFGQNLWEEVSIVTSGGNYGWNVREGTHCFSTATPNESPAECPEVVGAGHPREGDPLIAPVIEFANARQEDGLGQVVVGGYVYRGSMLPALEGSYIFGVWSRAEEETGEGVVELPGRIFVAEPQEDGLWPFSELVIGNREDGDLDRFLLSFSQDLEGEVYALLTSEVGPTGTTGEVYQIVPAGAATAAADDPEVPDQLVLEQNYPNPFNPTTTIRYHVAEAGPVTLTIYDMLGRVVDTLVDRQAVPGTYSVEWDGTDASGRRVASGLYLYRLQTGSTTETRAMTLLR